MKEVGERERDGVMGSGWWGLWMDRMGRMMWICVGVVNIGFVCR